MTTFHKSHWTSKQRALLNKLMKNPEYRILFYCSDQHGYSANGGTKATRCEPLVVHKGRNGARACGDGALHATDHPHKWAGSRVWIVALKDAREVEPGKWYAYERIVIGDILPGDVFSMWVGARVGRKDLYGANLRSANLYGANLRSADLRSADLYGANLYGADLRSANLRSANLYGANLRSANLRSADLYGANLYGANLYGAYGKPDDEMAELIKRSKA